MTCYSSCCANRLRFLKGDILSGKGVYKYFAIDEYVRPQTIPLFFFDSWLPGPIWCQVAGLGTQGEISTHLCGMNFSPNDALYVQFCITVYALNHIFRPWSANVVCLRSCHNDSQSLSSWIYFNCVWNCSDKVLGTKSWVQDFHDDKLNQFGCI